MKKKYIKKYIFDYILCNIIDETDTQKQPVGTRVQDFVLSNFTITNDNHIVLPFS